MQTAGSEGFQPSRAHLNTLIAAAGPDITARARWLVRNNGYAANAIESWAGNVVGAGIKPSSLIADSELKAQVQKLWLDWTDEADAEGFTDFYGLQRRAAREVFIAGEVFFRFRPRRPQDGLTVPLQLQMLPSEMLPLNRNEVSPGGNVIRQGIEFDAIGRRVAYHFLRRHPGDMTDPGLAGEIVRIPASEIVHIIDPVDAGQLRGVSRFAAGIVKLFLLDQYDDAELDRKKVAAMHALFITTPAPAEPLDAAEGRDENDERTHRPAAGPDHHAGAGRGGADLGAGGFGADLRAVPVPHAAAGLGRARRALCVSLERHAQGELLELAPGAARIPPPHRGLPACRDRLAAVPPGLGALDGHRGDRGRARSAGLRPAPA